MRSNSARDIIRESYIRLNKNSSEEAELGSADDANLQYDDQYYVAEGAKSQVQARSQVQYKQADKQEDSVNSVSKREGNDGQDSNSNRESKTRGSKGSAGSKVIKTSETSSVLLAADIAMVQYLSDIDDTERLNLLFQRLVRNKLVDADDEDFKAVCISHGIDFSKDSLEEARKLGADGWDEKKLHSTTPHSSGHPSGGKDKNGQVGGSGKDRKDNKVVGVGQLVYASDNLKQAELDENMRRLSEALKSKVRNVT